MKQLNHYIFKTELIKLKIISRGYMSSTQVKYNINLFILVVFSFLVLSISSANIAKASEQDAMNFVNDLAARAIDIAKSTTLTDKEKENKLTNLFMEAVDTKFIAKFALGKYWRPLSPDQQKAYLDLYSKYLIDMYVPNFRKYTGNVIKVLNAKEVRENEYFVQTELGSGSSENNIQINYLMRKDPKGIEKFIVFDIVAEGVSLITTQRDEISSIMTDNNGDFNNLMNLLSQKIGHQPSNNNNTASSK